MYAYNAEKAKTIYEDIDVVRHALRDQPDAQDALTRVLDASWDATLSEQSRSVLRQALAPHRRSEDR